MDEFPTDLDCAVVATHHPHATFSSQVFIRAFGITGDYIGDYLSDLGSKTGRFFGNGH